MASFSDNPATIGFNPYIQQLPIQQMAEVGMQKQKQYDEGIQKIQNNIENIAGLDVSKDVHKQYLQSKLNQLGTKLKTVAAGDFSNYQLTNSVGGMVTSIAKDPIIQGAVGSTMRIRKQQASMEEADKLGKSSIQNKAKFSEDLNGWLNDNDVKSLYTGEYIQYIDIDKKLRDIGEKIHEIDSSIENPYQRDAAGNTMYFSTDPKTGTTTYSVDASSGGKPRTDLAMLSIKTKGKPAEKILANFYDSLNADDQRQLKIDSWYHYKGTSPESLVRDVTKNYTENKQLISDGILNASVQLSTDTKLTSTQKSQMQASINSAGASLSDGSLEKALQKQIEEIKSSPNAEDYKYKIYTQKYLTSLARDVSYQSIQQEYKDNPYFQADMKIKDLKYKYDEANAVESRFMRSLNLQGAKFQWDQQMDLANLKLATDKAAGENALPIGDVGRISTSVETPTISGMAEEIHALSRGVDALNAEYAPNITSFPEHMKREGVQKAYLNRMAKAYKEDPGFIKTIEDPEMIEYLKIRREFDRKIISKHQTYINILDKSKVFDEKLSQTLASEPPVVVNGKTYSAKDLYEMKAGFDAINSPGYIESGKNIIKDIKRGIYSELADNRFINKNDVPIDDKELAIKNYVSQFKGTNKEELANALISGNIYNPMLGAMRRVYNDNKDKVDGIYKSKLDFQSQELSRLMPERQTTNFTLDKENNKNDEKAIIDIIGKANKDYTVGGVDVTKNSDYDPSTVQALRKDPLTMYRINKKYDGTASLDLINGETVQTIPIDASYFSANFPKYSKRTIVDDIKEAIQTSDIKSTNPFLTKDGSAAVNAFLSGYDIPQLRNTKYASQVRFDVQGSFKNIGDDNDLFTIKMYGNTPSGWKPILLTNQGYLNSQGLYDAIQAINTNTAEEFFKKK